MELMKGAAPRAAPGATPGSNFMKKWLRGVAPSSEQLLSESLRAPAKMTDS